MLYERWRKVVGEHRTEVAVRDAAGGGRWTFAQLNVLAEQDDGISGVMACPQGASVEFIFALLRAWRVGRVVCPLEPGQAPPALSACPQGCVHLKTTSATTGAPRAIAFTGEQLVADVGNIVATMGLRPDWPNLGAVSFAHSYGFSNLILPLVLFGIPLILPGATLPEAVRRAAKSADRITLAAVPALWRVWHDAGAIPPNTQLAISSGAPLPLSLEQSVFESAGVKIHNFYGASECGGIACDMTASPRTDAACVGAPMKNVSLSVNEDGCLEVRSRAVGMTYWPEPDEDLGGGVYRTSDLADMRGKQVFLRGRAGDRINVAGRKVSPETIERVLQGHPGVRECLVLGVPRDDGARTESIAAVVAGGPALKVEDLRAFAQTRLPAWQVPREWRLVEGLATNQRGKVSRTEWRRRLMEPAG